jgi:hypothetical protein
MRKTSALAILLLAVTAFLGQQSTVDADNARLVRLTSNVAQGRSYQIPFNVEPEILVIDKGTVVIWTLFGAHHAKVLFQDGKKCDAATDAPVGFELDSETAPGCYASALVPNGGTASLKFKETGVYEYSVEWANFPQKTRAKIVVH